MSVSTNTDGKKLIQTSIAILCIILGYVLIQFFGQLNEWFELESKVSYFVASSQGLAVLISLGVFVFIMKDPKISTFLSDVYQETIKVVWPDKNDTVKHTVIIIIGITIVGFLLGLFDIGASWLLSLTQ